MDQLAEYRFEVENAKALLAAERDPKKRRALLERLRFYQERVARIEQRRDEAGR
jgi:hypothetical protein